MEGKNKTELERVIEGMLDLHDDVAQWSEAEIESDFQTYLMLDEEDVQDEVETTEEQAQRIGRIMDALQESRDEKKVVSLSAWIKARKRTWQTGLGALSVAACLMVFANLGGMQRATNITYQSVQLSGLPAQQSVRADEAELGAEECLTMFGWDGEKSIEGFVLESMHIYPNASIHSQEGSMRMELTYVDREEQRVAITISHDNLIELAALERGKPTMIKETPVYFNQEEGCKTAAFRMKARAYVISGRQISDAALLKIVEELIHEAS